MAKVAISMGTFKKPVKPGLNAPAKQWEVYEKNIKVYNAKVAAKKKEQDRRKKVK